jgi:transposase InsO family protein
VGWALSDTIKSFDTSIAAWRMAIKNRPVTQKLLFHSHKCVQYVCADFREHLKGLPVVQSRSRKGNCWDNEVAESFFKILKTVLIYHTDYATKQQAKLSIFEYIEAWYNPRKRYSALDNRNPE